MKYLTIALIAFMWLNLYSIPIGTSPVHPVLKGDRFEYAVRVGKSALPTITLMNEALDPDTRVYGLWLEDHRVYCDFQLVGSIYGYGSHLRLNEELLYDYLVALDCEYFMYDRRRMERSAPYFDGVKYEVPVDSEEWLNAFEECEEFYPLIEGNDGVEYKMTPNIKVWRLIQ